MIAFDEDSLICDLAETYQIYDYKRLPLKLVASLSIGLREDSRIKMKVSGQEIPTDVVLMATIIDKLNILIWAKTKDAQKGKNKPKSLLEMINNKKELESFDSIEEFELKRQELIRQVKRGD